MPRWDIFCRVVDNFGDIGICWRLARQLAEEFGFEVRLWVDNLETFARLCPAMSKIAPRQIIGPIEVCHWPAEFPSVSVSDVADVVIEAFACEIPPGYALAMSQRETPPVWINLEYLSAEAWIEGCHLRSSPRARSNLKKYFFFPGFTGLTGGLLRERDLLTRRAAFEGAAAEDFWRRLGTPLRLDDELRVSLFCYESAPVEQLLAACARSAAPVRILTTPGHATSLAAHWLGEPLTQGRQIERNSLILQAIPFLSQADYDQLLWACDINFVRGEDSFVRAQWAQKPFVWQIYPQDENAHVVKLDAFLARYLAGFQDPQTVSAFWQAWNGRGDVTGTWQVFVENRLAIEERGRDWAAQLDRAGNLADNLRRFALGE